MKKTRAFLVIGMAFCLVIAACQGSPPPVEAVPETAPVPAPSTVPPADFPVLEVRLSPRFFSPDNDGVDDVLSITLSVQSGSAIRDWSFKIFDAQSPALLFHQWNGTGNPPAVLEWDGKNTAGELLESAVDYPYVFTVVTVRGHSAERKGQIEVDVLVQREGEQLRVQIPSIYFAANIGNFSGLNRDISAANDFVLRRIAMVLSKFNTYRVKVEGHANHVVNIPPAARQREQDLELQPLSEQRAGTVLDYLVTLGVDQARLSSFGLGGTRPVVPYEDRSNWWKNRRVEFILVK